MVQLEMRFPSHWFSCASALAVLLSLGLGSQTLFAQERPTIQRLTAEFVMERQLKALADTLRSEGKLSLGGPGLLRWEMTAPGRSVLVVNQGRGSLHYPDSGIRRSFDLGDDPVMKVLSEHLLVLTRGTFAELNQLYDSSREPDGVHLLIPRDPQIRRFFSSLRVELGEQGVVSWVELISASGDTTKITFHKIKLNPVIPPDLFAI